MRPAGGRGRGPGTTERQRRRRTLSGIGVVINPNAGSNRRRPDRARRFEEILGDAGIVRVTPNLAEMDTVAAEFAARRTDIVAVCGGDGSQFRTLSALRKMWPNDELPLFLPLRAGTMNYIARSIGCMRGGPEHVLAHVVRDYRHGRTHDIVHRHLLLVNDVHAGFVVGCGVVVNYLRLYYSEPRPGPVTATRLLVRLVASAIGGTSLVRGVFRRVEADVDCDDERVPFRTFTVILGGTITHIALGFRPMYLAARKRSHFHLLAGPIGPLRLARKIVRFHRGFPLEEPDFYDNLARTVTIRFATPTGFMMDGDVLDPADTLTITTGPLLAMIRG
jgi:diacylglycerol kinase (ATP)